MSFLGALKELGIIEVKDQFPGQQKSVSNGLFGFFNTTSLPKIKEKEQLRTYHGWVYACTNAIAERVADIDLKLQTKVKTDWQDITTTQPAMELLHDVNSFMSFYDLVFNYQAFQELNGNTFWYLNRNGNDSKIAEI